MAGLSAQDRVLEQLLARRTDVAATVGEYLAATGALTHWVAAGRPDSAADNEIVERCIGSAQDAVLGLESLALDLADAVRQAREPRILRHPAEVTRLTLA